ncbi:MAG: hypothetical protein U1F60_02225 [Planctomycetota bacterium]
MPRGRDVVDAIECKWRPEEFATRGLAAFRASYPKGRNFVVAPLDGPSYQRRQDDLELLVVSPAELRLAFPG